MYLTMVLAALAVTALSRCARPAPTGPREAAPTSSGCGHARLQSFLPDLWRRPRLHSPPVAHPIQREARPTAFRVGPKRRSLRSRRRPLSHQPRRRLRPYPAMMNRASIPLEGRRVPITGAARGIGAGAADACMSAAHVWRSPDWSPSCWRESPRSAERPRSSVTSPIGPGRARRGGRRREPGEIGRGDRQRRHRIGAAADRGRPRGLRAHHRGQPARRLLHRARRRPPHRAPPRVRAGDRLARGGGARADAGPLQRLEGGGGGVGNTL